MPAILPAQPDATPRLRVGLLDADPIRVVGFAAEFENNPRLEIVPLPLAGIVADQTLSVCLLGLRGKVSPNPSLTSLRAQRPSLRVLLMGPELSDADMLTLLAAGGRGYVPEAATAEEIEQAIEQVHGGAVFVPKRVLTRFADISAQTVELPPPPPDLHLTAREREVLQLLVAAQSNREIARALGIEERTVKAHIAKLMRKVGVDNRIALSVFAVRNAIFATSGNLGGNPGGK